jgi:hypothetical protein
MIGEVITRPLSKVLAIVRVHARGSRRWIDQKNDGSVDTICALSAWPSHCN